MSAMLILGLLITASVDFTVAQIGIAYGRNGDKLPAPPQVVALYKQYGIQRMRIYEPHQPTLDALRGSNIELTMSILNTFLPGIAGSQANADAWVRDNVRNYIPGVNFRNIVVGNEISPTSENNQFVLQAMRNVDNAISAAGLGDQIKVTTSIATDLIAPPGFPPEDGAFKPEVIPYLTPIIQFVASKRAPLFASIYPYFSYLDNPGQIDLRYALLDPSYPGVTTRYGNTYKNLYDAIFDTVYAAIERIVGSSLSDAGIETMELGGGESGWPTIGGPPKPAASVDDVSSVDNARTYINNLIQVVKNGTPKRPGRPRQTFIFAMFDENQKPGREDERHFGLFTPDGQPKYQVNFN